MIIRRTLFSITLILASQRAFAQIPANPLLWLRSDTHIVVNDSSVISWNDMNDASMTFISLGNAAHPGYSSTGFNGHPSVIFDGATQYLQGPSIYPVSHDYTVFIVSRASDFTKTNNIFSGMSGHAIWLNGSYYPDVFHGNFSTVATSEVPFGDTAMILGVKFDQATQIAAIRINGVDADSNVIGTNTDSTALIGAFGNGNLFAGSIAEIILYNRYLTPSEQDTIEHYLEARYAIAGPTPPPPQNIVFTSLPKTRQLYPRGANDSAVVAIAGYVKSPNADSIYLDIYKNTFWQKRIEHSLVFQDGAASFSFSESIKAEPTENRYVVGLLRGDGWDSVIANCDSIVSGDVLFICGQSNSIVGSSTESFRSEFCRTFGNNMGQRSDTSWTLSDVSQNGGGPDVGEWGLTLQKLFLETYNLPTVIINGGVGGTAIEQHERNNVDPEDILTIYGNMLYRAKHSGLDTVAPMMYWYQGESSTPTNYYDNFKLLYNSWRSDYPKLRKFYVIQIHPGCSQAGAPELRELLRTLPDSLPDIQTYCPDGSPGHDGCHYLLGNGYETIGAQLFSLLQRDFYNAPDTAGIESPNLSVAFYTDTSHTTVDLIFSPKNSVIRIGADTVIGNYIESIKNYFYFDNDTSAVRSISASNDTITLMLKSALTAKTISYLPDQYYNDTLTTYEGPWLSSQRGVGAFSFWNVPIIERSELGVAPAAPGQIASASLNIEARNIELSLSKPLQATLEVFDELGRRVDHYVNSILDAGNYTYPLPNIHGAYFIVLTTPDGVLTQKIVLQ